ncbi:MAG: exo-alpha-sialidase, partial [Bacteroidetes bacterium]|nr:exo-alpha-sialidase [Bacteroidota bacterium]
AAGRDNTASEGQIYLFYEGEGGGKIARFNLAWLTEGHDWREFLQE